MQAEDGRKYRRNRQHLRVCPAQGRGILNGKLSSGADQTVVQDEEPLRDEPGQTTTPTVLQDMLSKEQHPEPEKENGAGPIVTRSGR